MKNLMSFMSIVLGMVFTVPALAKDMKEVSCPMVTQSSEAKQIKDKKEADKKETDNTAAVVK